jgi:hypothetical protein
MTDQNLGSSVINYHERQEFSAGMNIRVEAMDRVQMISLDVLGDKGIDLGMMGSTQLIP